MEERYKYDNTKVHALASATATAEPFPSNDQTITYTGFDKVGKVKQGNDSLCYTYGYDWQRILMEEHVCGLTRTKQYWGACEYVTESDGSNTSSLWRTFVAGPYGVFAVVESRNGINDTHYVLKDNLGSWTTITDGNGTVEQRLSYDAWGNLRDPNTWANYTVGDTFDKPMFDRGYTGHEHLADFGLINMNGRVYDPLMSSFLSADRFVQNPLTAQGFNRYSYCMNNPLRFIDPTGWLPGDGGSGGSLPHIIIGGQTNYILPEIKPNLKANDEGLIQIPAGTLNNHENNGSDLLIRGMYFYTKQRLYLKPHVRYVIKQKTKKGEPLELNEYYLVIDDEHKTITISPQPWRITVTNGVKSPNPIVLERRQKKTFCYRELKRWWLWLFGIE